MGKCLKDGKEISKRFGGLPMGDAFAVCEFLLDIIDYFLARCEFGRGVWCFPMLRTHWMKAAENRTSQKSAHNPGKAEGVEGVRDFVDLWVGEYFLAFCQRFGCLVEIYSFPVVS